MASYIYRRPMRSSYLAMSMHIGTDGSVASGNLLAHMLMPVRSMAETVVRTGRPPRLSRADEFELYCYRKSGVSIRQCAAFFRVSVPTANRIIAKFREYDSRIEPTARAFRDSIKSLIDST